MKYKNALCIYPYKRELKAFGFFPPIGLEYIASAVEDIVDSVRIIDLRHEKKPLTSFIDSSTDLALISYNWGVEEEFVRHTINSIPKNVTVIIGGRHATEHVEELFKNIPRIDGIVRGDGEETAREIVAKGISRDIDGLSFRLNDKIVHNKNRRLDSAKREFFPNRKLRSYKYTVALDGLNSGIQIDLMLASRGCPFNCKFCDFKFNPLGQKRKWSCRTPESVISEIKTTQAEVIAFADNIFTADMDWVDHLCDLMIKEGIRKKYVINTRLEVAKRPEVLEKMYKAGFRGFLIGIESSHDKTLASMNKGFTVKKIREYFEVLRKFNFFYHCYFIIGNIGETRDEILDITKFSHELGIDTLGLSILRATKYSPVKDMIKQLDEYHIEENSGKVYSDMLSIDELQQIRREIYASFFTIPVILRILKKLIIYRFLTIGRLNRIIIHVARKKIQKMAKKRNLIITVKELTPIHKI